MLSFGFWEPVIIFTALNVMVVSGLYVTALPGQLSMASAALAGLGGYVSAILTTNFDLDLWPALLAAAAASALTGAAIALITRRMRDFILKLTTIALGEMMSVVAFNLPYVGGANGFSGIPLYADLPLVLGATLAGLFIAWRFDASVMGLEARAIRDDGMAAASMGASPLAVRMTAFALGSAIIGVAGALSAHYVLVIVPSQLGFAFSLTFIIFLLAGGLQTLWGGVLAAILLTALPELLRFANEYRMIIYGLVIVGVVLGRPSGLLTRTRDWTGGAIRRGRAEARRQGPGSSALSRPSATPG